MYYYWANVLDEGAVYNMIKARLKDAFKPPAFRVQYYDHQDYTQPSFQTVY